MTYTIGYIQTHDTHTCVNVTVLPTILGRDYRTHVCSTQSREQAELSVEFGDLLWAGYHLTTCSRGTHMAAH